MSGGFEDLGLMPELVRATQDQGWLLPSDIQDEAIPLILGGGDVMAAAETGSGKTGAFALPAIQTVHETRRAAASAAAAAAAASASSAGPSSSGAPLKRARQEDIILNVEDRSSMVAISPDGLMAQCRQERDWGGARATRGVLRGDAYYEVVMRDEGLCRVGWSTKAAGYDLGKDKFGYGYGGTGKKSNGGSFDSYGEEFKGGDVIGCYLSLTEAGGSIAWSKNGKHLGDAFKVPKGVGALYPAICMKNAELQVNFGRSSFVHPPSNGFVALSQLPPGNIAGGNDLFPSSSSSSSSNGSSSPSAAAGGGGGGKKNAGNESHPVCVILEPARDLALQTARAVDDLKKFVTSPTISCGCLIGGMSNAYVREQAILAKDIVVATPQSLLVSIRAGDISLDSVRLLVLDEADRFTEKENLEMLDKLYKGIRSSIDTAAAPGRLQVCFFSATLHSKEIADLSARLCSHPTWVDLKGKDSVPDTVHHVVVNVDPYADRSWASSSSSSSSSSSAAAGTAGLEVPTDGVHAKEKLNALTGGAGGASSSSGNGNLSKEEASETVKRLKPRMLVSLIDSLAMTQCLIFCRTNVDCDNLEAYLTACGGGQKWRAGTEKGKENAYSCCVLAGMRSQDERTRNLQAFKDGDVRFLICTDVAARGLDIAELPYVVNMTLPDEPENYIHRIGRVGRADRMGLAISFVSTKADEKVWFHTCGAKGGKGCHNTNLVNMTTKTGGCTTWYDEPGKFAAIKKRLAMPTVPEMQCIKNGVGPKGTVVPYLFSLPPEIADLGVAYGEEKGSTQEPSAHIEAIRGQVASLLKLEVDAQSAYLALKMKYGVAGGGNGKGAANGSGGGGKGKGKGKA